MKKFLRCFPIVILMLIIYSFIYNNYNKEQEYITEENAIGIAQDYIKKACSNEYVETLLNYHSPEVEMRYVNHQAVHLSGKGKKIIDAVMCWCVIFTTPHDKFVGSHEVYIDGVSGKVLGSPFGM